MEAIGIWRGSLIFILKNLGGPSKFIWYSVLGGGGGALKTYFNNRSGLEKYFKVAEHSFRVVSGVV